MIVKSQITDGCRKEFKKGDLQAVKEIRDALFTDCLQHTVFFQPSS